MAISRVPGAGPVYVKKLITHFGDAAAVFQATKQALSATGIPEDAAAAIVKFSEWAALEAELFLLKKKGVRLLFFTDAEYPRRLLDVRDSPPLLFYKGNADLNAERLVAIVGTRHPSNYGREVTAQLIRQMARPGMLIISGLASGIDAAAHRAALVNGLPTVGILGHGLGHIYPFENEGLAKEMVADGGLLTSHEYDDKPEGFHFPDRNRVVAALCDALVVVESGKSGGSMLTAKAALGFRKPVFAVPGRIMETRSAGCNALIRQGKATMLTAGDQLAADLGWKWPRGGTGVQGSLLLTSAGLASAGPAFDGMSPAGRADETTADEQLLGLLKEKGSLDIDEIARQTGQSSSGLALILLQLELAGQVIAMPGKRYRFNAPVIHD